MKRRQLFDDEHDEVKSILKGVLYTDDFELRNVLETQVKCLMSSGREELEIRIESDEKMKSMKSHRQKELRNFHIHDDSHVSAEFDGGKSSFDTILVKYELE